MSEEGSKEARPRPHAARAVIAGAAIGSAAIAAALLYASHRRRKKAAGQHAPIPSGEKPETD